MVSKKTLYLADPAINLRDWVGEFSRQMTGKDVVVVPAWSVRLAALMGDAAVRLGVRKFPITTFRFENMTTENVVDIEPVMAIAPELPFTVSQGIVETVAWLKEAWDER